MKNTKKSTVDLLKEFKRKGMRNGTLTETERSLLDHLIGEADNNRHRKGVGENSCNRTINKLRRDYGQYAIVRNPDIRNDSIDNLVALSEISKHTGLMEDFSVTSTNRLATVLKDLLSDERNVKLIKKLIENNNAADIAEVIERKERNEMSRSEIEKALHVLFG